MKRIRLNTTMSKARYGGKEHNIVFAIMTTQVVGGTWWRFWFDAQGKTTGRVCLQDLKTKLLFWVSYDEIELVK